jgi:glycosyltransferase involved in cell wall biosynthesis
MLATATDKTLGRDRGSVLVCVPVTAADALALASARSVLEHSDASVAMLLMGTSAALDQLVQALDGDAGGRALLGLVVESGAAAGALNEAIRVSFPSDVAVVVPGVLVSAGWLDGLRAAALSDSTVASATPLSFGVGALELAGGGEPSRSAEGAAACVRQGAQPLYPRIATIGPGCAYIRRTALELAGPLEESLSLADALSDLALRTTALGMVHVAADDVLVEGLEGGLVEEAAIDNDVQRTIAGDEQGPLRRSLDRARTAQDGLSVTIDGRALNANAGGTQTYILELILALARAGEVALRVLVPPDLSQRASDALASVPEVALLTYEQALADAPKSDVVHRPQQVFTPDDLTLLRLVGERVVIGQQDLVAYHNYSYHRDGDVWRSYRRTTRLALAGADQVVFFSEHARRDALAEDLLPAVRTHVVGIGADAIEPSRALGGPPARPGSPSARPGGAQAAPQAAGALADGPFLLCMGADYAHKNRPFAIELLGALRELGWGGRLVLAGAHVPHGSSREREQALLHDDPELAEGAIDLGAVDEQEKAWLYEHASALLYPTIYEGFGLLPVEAARAGLPCLFAAQASLAELAGAAATLVPWDAHASARAVLALLSDGPAREAHLAELRALPIPGWSDVAHRLVAVYERALAAPPSEAAPRAWQELDRESYVLRLAQDIAELKRTAQEYQDAYHALEARVSAGLPLIDEGGLLSPAQQRGLMRVAGRGRLGAWAVAPLGLLGRGEQPDTPEA